MSAPLKPDELLGVSFTVIGIAGAALLGAAAAVAVGAWLATRYRDRHESKNPTNQHIPRRARRFNVVTVVKWLVVPGVTLLMVWMVQDADFVITGPAPSPMGSSWVTQPGVQG